MATAWESLDGWYNGSAGTPAGVREDLGRRVPVVSLRSTTGYRLTSLRDDA